MTGQERHAEETRRVAADGEQYHCQAYGPDSRGYCFLEAEFECQSRLECVRSMEGERMLSWVRLHARAQQGDKDCIEILKAFTSPEQLLNGDYWSSIPPGDWPPSSHG